MARLTVGTMAMPSTVGRVLLGLLPLWILLILLIVFPGFMDPVGANPPDVAGLPAGIVLVFVALAVMAFGVVALRRASSTRSMLLAFLLLTVPAAAVIFVAPALILIVQNMALP
jgi:glucan phosphoethanolaminetransferase (alkaline phosphatase superfamily)